MVDRVYRYKEYIDVDEITIKRKSTFYRYLLTIPIKSVSKDNVLVILKNPSKANNIESDHSINNVLKFCEKHYGKVYIMNIFPFYSTKSEKVKDFICSDDYDREMDINSATLKETLDKVNEIIAAWGGGGTIGNKRKYDEVISEVLSTIRNSNKKIYYVRERERSHERKYPWHAQVWAVNKDLMKVELKIKN